MNNDKLLIQILDTINFSISEPILKVFLKSAVRQAFYIGQTSPKIANLSMFSQNNLKLLDETTIELCARKAIKLNQPNYKDN